MEWLRKNAKGGKQEKQQKGIIIALIAGVLMSLFYRFVVKGMDVESFNSPAIEICIPYSAIFVFSNRRITKQFCFPTH